MHLALLRLKYREVVPQKMYKKNFVLSTEQALKIKSSTGGHMGPTEASIDQL